MEEAILFPERFLASQHMCFLDLKFHVCVGYLGNWAQEESKRQRECEHANGKIYPLDRFERVRVIGGVFEEYIRCQSGCDNAANTIESLRKVDSNF